MRCSAQRLELLITDDQQPQDAIAKPNCQMEQECVCATFSARRKNSGTTQKKVRLFENDRHQKTCLLVRMHNIVRAAEIGG
eukprot:2213528-Amphidinium_carterae.1